MADNINHNVPTIGMGQATFQQCWYASFKMIYKFKGLNVNSIEDKLRNVIDFDDAMADGLVDKDYHKCAGALDLTSWKGEHFNQEQGFFDVGLSDGAESFHACLRKGPLWVSRYIKKGTYHITVATKYDDEGKGYIYYNNPYPGPKHAVEEKMPANVFCRHITYATGSVQQ
ncbi:MAG TPA: papain-like cysteine protease family protein [Aridibacter sp.]|nr:papain-like cysteine protease family protein [Aridibacter sp.]